MINRSALHANDIHPVTFETGPATDGARHRRTWRRRTTLTATDLTPEQIAERNSRIVDQHFHAEA